MANTKLTLVEQWERFWSRIDKTNDCWNWTAATNSGGYGSMQYAGRLCGAHRLMLFWCGVLPSPAYAGDMTKGLVLHSCDNRLCVNPTHLSVGTAKQNAQEMFARSRAVRPSGHLHPRALFTVEQIKHIRTSIADGTKKVSELAREFGTSISVISSVRDRMVYKGQEYE